MSSFKTQTWKTRGSLNVVIAPDMSDTTLPADKQPVRQVAQTFGQGLDENMANARLIASAPDMYRLIASFAALPNEQCMVSPMIHAARKLIARIDG